MARFDTKGLDNIIGSMKRVGELSGAIADEMLIAGAEEVKQAWRQAAKIHGHVETGDMHDSIGYSRKPKTVNDIKSIDIYPQGKDRKGKRNAEKAFILNYGTKKRPGSHWVDTADALSAEPVTRVMTEIWTKHLESEEL